VRDVTWLAPGASGDEHRSEEGDAERVNEDSNVVLQCAMSPVTHRRVAVHGVEASLVWGVPVGTTESAPQRSRG